MGRRTAGVRARTSGTRLYSRPTAQRTCAASLSARSGDGSEKRAAGPQSRLHCGGRPHHRRGSTPGATAAAWRCWPSPPKEPAQRSRATKCKTERDVSPGLFSRTDRCETNHRKSGCRYTCPVQALHRSPQRSLMRRNIPMNRALAWAIVAAAAGIMVLLAPASRAEGFVYFDSVTDDPAAPLAARTSMARVRTSRSTRTRPPVRHRRRRRPRLRGQPAQRQGSNTIGRSTLDGELVDQTFIEGAHTPCGVAVDGAYIYWANTSGPVERNSLCTTNGRARISTAAPPTSPSSRGSARRAGGRGRCPRLLDRPRRHDRSSQPEGTNVDPNFIAGLVDPRGGDRRPLRAGRVRRASALPRRHRRHPRLPRQPVLADPAHHQHAGDAARTTDGTTARASNGHAAAPSPSNNASRCSARRRLRTA